MRWRSLAPLGMALLSVTCSPSPQAAWWAAIADQCGRAFAGNVVSEDQADQALEGQRLIMHVRRCDDSRLEIPFHVGDDRSRTWVLTRTAAGIQLQHDHRHEDGTPDALTLYGGRTISAGSATVQEFPADEYSQELFIGRNFQESRKNVWSMEIVAGESFSYVLRRPKRHFRAEFDLTRPVEPPPPPWGYE